MKSGPLTKRSRQYCPLSCPSCPSGAGLRSRCGLQLPCCHPRICSESFLLRSSLPCLTPCRASGAPRSFGSRFCHCRRQRSGHWYRPIQVRSPRFRSLRCLNQWCKSFRPWTQRCLNRLPGCHSSESSGLCRRCTLPWLFAARR